MRHLKHRSQLGRTKEHRAALMANMSAALLRHGRITTTLPKAKALRPYVERVITLAVKAKASPEKALHLRRQALAKVRDKDSVGILFNERAQEFASRNGGYTRIYKLVKRIGDAADMAIIELIPAADTGYPKKGKTTAAASANPEVASEPEAVAETAPEAEAETASVAGEAETPAQS